MVKLNFQSLRPLRSRILIRRTSSSPRSTPDPQPSRQSAPSRIDRWIAHSPKFLRPKISALRNAPVSHITAFAILHELTAIVPLVALACAFHYGQWLPSYFVEGKWVVEGAERFGRYFRKKGWISEESEEEAKERSKVTGGKVIEDVTTRNSTRWVLEFATAWAVVKAFLPLRIAISVWWAPGFAKMVILPFRNGVTSIFRRS